MCWTQIKFTRKKNIFEKYQILDTSIYIDILPYFVVLSFQIHCVQTQSSESLSMSMLVGGFACCLAWLVYGIMLADFYIYVSMQACTFYSSTCIIVDIILILTETSAHQSGHYFLLETKTNYNHKIEWNVGAMIVLYCFKLWTHI